MRFSIEREGESALSTHYQPNYVPSILLMAISLVVGVIFLVEPSLSLCLLTLILFSISIYGVSSERELSCLINTSTGILSYKRGGILGSQHDAQNTQYNISELKTIEMKRHMGRGRDTFQIRLVLSANHQLNLSPANLNFPECQNLANQIHQFIGPEKPLIAVD